MRSPRVSARGLLAPLALMVVAAGVAFPHGVTDFQYQLAGLADPFLGRPAPILSVALLAFCCLVAAVALALIRWAQRHDTSPGAPMIGWRWLGFFAVGCSIGYLAGAGSVVAGGGPISYAGTVTLTYSAPVNATIALNAACSTPVDKPDVVARLTVGRVAIDLRDRATGKPYATNPEAWVATGIGLGSELIPATIAQRPPLIRQSVGAEGTVSFSQPVPFFAAYDSRPLNRADSGLSGRMAFEETRRVMSDSQWERYVNATVANDPWPEAFSLALDWTCRG